MIDISLYNSDQLLWQNAAAGDLKAFEELYNRYWELLLREGYKVLKDREEAEDVVQNLFVDLYGRLGTVIVDDIKAYLLQANRYAIYKRIRQYITEKKYRTELTNLFGQDNVAEEVCLAEYRELEMAVSASIARLPEKCREAFLLSRNQGLSYARIAHQLRISERTVEKHISKALRCLREDLSPEYSHYFRLVVLLWYFF